MKTANQIRQEFLDFFKERGHTIVPSASLIPDNDQTLLFTNAGMNQFKDVFLGTGSRPYKRAADTQKVMRVSGKHNDFDDVGRDTYHHTFFEMLGNWSFNDYYKSEAVKWAWELLTEVWKLPKERLYATVHDGDDESFEIWASETDIDHSHILKFGDKENFWEMGASGPCGPCSEIHIDLTPNLADSIGAKGVNADDPLFIELWNLVFIQYDRQENGELKDLPSKNVDTGMGFERITAVLQGKTSNYDSDLFSPIIEFIAKDSGTAYSEGVEGTPHRVIADHIRALTFAIADGIIPSNEGRGYVIRKILRRAVRFGRELGYTKAFLYKIVPVVVDMMGGVFPEIKEHQASIESVIKSEEDSFFRTLNKGFDKIKELISNAKSANNNTISGDEVFLLYDSMGFPVDFTEQILKDEDLDYDTERFSVLMNEQKERARASWKGAGINFSAFGSAPKTIYIEAPETRSVILGIVRDSENVDSANEGDDIALILDETPFYGEKGGQIGDSGTIKNGGDNIIEIFDTKIFEDKHIHLGRVVKGSVKKGDSVSAAPDASRKKDIARHHSTAHLLFKALRSVLGRHIGQAGSWVGDNRTRIDFTHPKALTADELQQIAALVNKDILQNHKTHIQELPIDEAKAKGAVAAFEEKYGDIVRVVSLGDSIELCGGTHVESTGDIGTAVIISESSVSAGTRRLEALSGQAALDYINSSLNREKQIADTLKCSPEEILEKLKKIMDDSRQKDKEIKTLQSAAAEQAFKTLLDKAEDIKGHKIIVSEAPQTQIQDMVNAFKNGVPSGVLVLGALKADGGAVISAAVTKDLTAKIKAGVLIKELLAMIDGKGGGKDDQAMGGGSNGAALQKTLDKSFDIIKKSI